MGALVGVVLLPRPALAIQPHGSPEGFYLHLIAHLVFIGALVFFIFKLRQEIVQTRSFHLLIWACALFIGWNLMTFIAHLSALSVRPQDFSGMEGHLSRRLTMSGLSHWIYYFASLDHLILVPAGYLFYRGLKALAQEPVTG